MSVLEVSDDLATIISARAASHGISADTWLRALVDTDDDPFGTNEQAKLEWLRTAAREGFDAIDEGDFVALTSPSQIADFMREIHDGMVLEMAAERYGAGT